MYVVCVCCVCCVYTCVCCHYVSVGVCVLYSLFVSLGDSLFAVVVIMLLLVFVFYSLCVSLGDSFVAELSQLCVLWWHYLSNATCLTRPHVFYACFVVSRSTISCYTIRHC